MWRPSRPGDDEAVVALCLALYAEDPGRPVDADQVRRTLDAFRREPVRGRAVVAEQEGRVVGYAFLVSFWSNEYGGELCAVDELYVVPSRRGRGLGTGLLEAIETDRALWPAPPVALELEVTPANRRARALYERLGFRARNATLRRVVRGPAR
jgi:GNAT superfamily N-acetyltransferase